jgi:ArsR family transcriptional regulator
MRAVIDGRAGALYRFLTMNKQQNAQCPDSAGCPPAAVGDDLRPVEGPAADEELSVLTKALGHPARVRILRILARRKSCICGDIVDEFDLAQSTVSQHLKILKDAGLIRGEIDGPRTCYCIEERALRRLKALVATI